MSPLPRELQEKELEVTIIKGKHRGVRQYTARYKRYKLVIAPPPGLSKSGISFRHGDRWTVRPERTPNGHVVFCRAIKRIDNESGEHPLIAATRGYVESGKSVSVVAYGTTGWDMRGPIQSVSVQDGQIRLVFRSCKYKRAGEISHYPTKNRTFKTAEESVQWSSAPYNRYLGEGRDRQGNQIQIVFWEF